MSADCSLQVVESQHRSGDLILANDRIEGNAFVVWTECDEPWRIEERLISAICLPLNLDQNRANRFHPVLSERRHRVRQPHASFPGQHDILKRFVIGRKLLVTR